MDAFNDDIIDEIRSIRVAHLQSFDYDVDRIFADIQRGESALEAQGWVLEKPMIGQTKPDFSVQRFRVPADAGKEVQA
jgi:hypothetical protein